jgi:hypothetical protein
MYAAASGTADLLAARRVGYRNWFRAAQTEQCRGRQRVAGPLGDEELERLDRGRPIGGAVVQVDPVPQGLPVPLVIRHGEQPGLGDRGISGMDEQGPDVLGAAGDVGRRLSVAGSGGLRRRAALDLAGPGLEHAGQLVEKTGGRRR